MADLAQQIRKRGSLKSKLTIFSKFLTPIFASFEKGEVMAVATATELKTRTEKFEGIFEEFEDVQLQIECSCDEEELDGQYNIREEFDNQYSKCLASARLILSGFEETLSQSGSEANRDIPQPLGGTDADQGNFGQSCDSGLKGVKLPTIELPKYRGSHINWLEYKDTFESLIHSNKSINNIQKYHYLRASLEGEALKVIQSLEFSSDNYTIAWEVLCKRFDNSRLLVHSHVKSIFEMENLTKESARALRNLIDTVNKHLRSLGTLGQPTEFWDTLLIYIITSKLDKSTAKEWEKYKIASENPSLEDMQTFLSSRADLLETLEVNHGIKATRDLNPRIHGRQTALTSSHTVCYNCKDSHRIHKCEDFLKLSIPNRITKIRQLRLCQNCLCSGHNEGQCRSGTCQKCKGRHNTLLHVNAESQITLCYNNPQTLVLLSTAKVTIRDSGGKKHLVTALLDSGSQSCFASEKLCRLLDVKQSKINMSVVGINKGVSNINSKCRISIFSHDDSFSDSLDCLVVPQITDDHPSFQFDITSWDIPKHIRLANEKFNTPSEIHLLIGASHFWNVIKKGKIVLGKDQPILQNTVFGYIVSGSINLPREVSHCHLSRNRSISNDLQKFWEIEEIDSPGVLSPDDIKCEQGFVDSVTRSDDGRFIVGLPLKFPPSHLGDSKKNAIQRFLGMERRLLGNSAVRDQYVQFMSEYRDLGHMSESNECSEYSYYLPHHSVLREDSLTTRLRIVFDGSAASDSGWSLNDLQYVGPPILNDIIPILLRFRLHNFVVCSDVEKMYRQILVHEDNRSLQKIVWRFDPNDPISVFTLNTVTYGTKSAPYLAMRCLRQLAANFKDENPVASDIIMSDFYVDDLITGFQSEDQAIRISKEISSILLSAGFPLRKWNSNSTKIVDAVRKEDDPINIVNLGDDDHTKTLGLRWVTNSDTLTFKVARLCGYPTVTKRNILSDISRLFDPLGLVSPSILVSKIIIQKLWTLQLDWDTPIPEELTIQWLRFREQLPLLNELQIRRQSVCPDAQTVELHGFCDASILGYGSVLYLRSIDSSQGVHVHLLCAKTKVAPLKVLTIPRLELCGAVMLARLQEKVTKSLGLGDIRCYLHCDSQIVLSWIKTQTRLLQTFVGNRVAEIQQLTKADDWHYIASENNPADIASRGALPSTLVQSHMWWHGPSRLSLLDSTWDGDNTQDIPFSELPETRKQTMALVSVSSEFLSFQSFSSLSRIKRVMSYVLRFVSNCRLRRDRRSTGFLTVRELSQGMQHLIRLSQLDNFSGEIETLQLNSQLNTKNKLLGLSPFLDSNGLLRVGGRLKNSYLRFESKHPLLLNGKHHLTRLIFEHYHRLYCHAAPQLLLSIVRREYWPTSGISIAKSVFHRCLTCFRNKPKSFMPKMADLPRERVTVMNPFTVTGIDYAGPFTLKDRKGKGCRYIKGYICLFICFASKAIHIEVVTELTTECFIAALRRFTARRGKPSRIFSDNGTNFVGAKRELHSLFGFLKQSQSDIMKGCADEGIIWKFIPPNSPHFGGIWESNIKQVKSHLVRVMGETKLVYEEFITVVIQIESVLNSRPLYPMSSDPNDLQPLTPSHFLIGKPLITVPDPSLKDVRIGRLSRFQLLQKINQDFWKSWSRDYLNHLQQRAKWRQESQNIKIGTLVIIKNDNLPPCSWIMGRVINIHPDNDGTVRVASVQCHKGVFKRAVTRLCPLPIQDNDETSKN